ncbi:hypothetical protein [Winogradskyella sp.]|uniref:hypothetical protein n=1 Tax=Winogradskyella sp. TaxID=1883156 RepID=UPI0035150025
MKKLVLLSFALVFGLMTFAQEKFEEGKIKMTQKMTTDNEQMKAMLKQMMGEEGMQITMYIKGDKSRVEMNNPMSGDMTFIAHSYERKSLMLMDNPYMGKKYTLTNVSEEEMDELEENVVIEEGTEVKTILGYECKEHIVTVSQDGAEVKMKMFITDKIAPVMTQQTAMLGDKLKGFPMYMVIDMNQQGVEMTVTAEVTELSKEEVPDGKFSLTPPEGYSEMQVPQGQLQKN